MPTCRSSHEIKITSSLDRAYAVQRRTDVDLGCFQVLQQRLGIIKQGGILILRQLLLRILLLMYYADLAPPSHVLAAVPEWSCPSPSCEGKAPEARAVAKTGASNTCPFSVEVLKNEDLELHGKPGQ